MQALLYWLLKTCTGNWVKVGKFRIPRRPWNEKRLSMSASRAKLMPVCFRQEVGRHELRTTRIHKKIAAELILENDRNHENGKILPVS